MAAPGKPAALAGLLVCSLVLAACVDRRPSVRERRASFDRSRLGEYVTTSFAGVPAPEGVRAIFGNYARLVSVEVDPPTPMPGTSARLTLVYEVLAEPDHDFRIFVHLEDRTGKVERLVLDHDPVNGGYPTTVWRTGEYVKDVTAFVVPPYTAPGTSFEIWTGLFREKERVPVMNRSTVRVDGSGRALAGAFVAR